MTWYDDAMRTIIDLPDDQIQALAELCARENISRAEAIRRAVSNYVCADQQDQSEFQRVLKATFGMWKDRGIDTDTYLAELRKEWDREWDPD
jgi:metal-responsive CopG/Arc/MetJ family transcriptional regulator